MKFGKMKSHRRNRLLLVLFVVLTTGVAVGLTMQALNENINLFYSTEQIAAGEAPVGPLIRAGGMVVAGSVVRSPEDLTVHFIISDLKKSEVTVQFVGILPDLFREGQGIIARGVLDDQGIFIAEEVLAKHDENYMPPEIADILEETHEGSSNYKDPTYKGPTYDPDGGSSEE
jgi:cytochrome c-type biogenesis protein CcmE